MARYKQVEAEKGRWSDWQQPIRRGYKMACCDCGLVHDMDFRLVQRNSKGSRMIQFRVARNNRSTAMIRRHDAARKRRNGGK